MTLETKKWFFEKLLYLPRLQYPENLGKEYIWECEKLQYLDGLKPTIRDLPNVEKQRIELRGNIANTYEQLIEYFKDNLPKLLTEEYLEYVRSLQGKVK